MKKMSSRNSSPLQGFFKICSSYAHHFKEYSCSNSHPVQLDFKGSAEGEVAMVIATAPFSPITAIVHINVQGDCFLLWNRGSWEGRGKNRARKIERVEIAKRMKWQRGQTELLRTLMGQWRVIVIKEFMAVNAHDIWNKNWEWIEVMILRSRRFFIMQCIKGMMYEAFMAGKHWQLSALVQ